jgi:hypothetical protein
VHANLGQHLTLLGICCLVFTLVMVATGKFPPEVLPQFLASVVIFLVAGWRLRGKTEEDEEGRPAVRRERRRLFHEADWPWLTRLLNWVCALLLLGILAIALAKPVGVSFSDAFSYSSLKAQEHFFAGAIP